jgi:GldM C-terminal domain/Gram-negative bacterial TonB protein C-terminal
MLSSDKIKNMIPIKVLLPIFVFCAINVKSQVSPPPPPDSVRIENRVFTKVDVEAGFPGGDAAWRNYLVKNLNANIPVDNDAPAGKYTTIIKFIISKDGTVSDIQPETNLGYGMEAEVVRIITKSGKWTPAEQNNRRVNAYRRQPVTFLVEEDDYEINTKVPYTLFAGTDNRISIDVNKVKPEDVTATVSQGTITSSGDGNFVIKDARPGRIIITVFNGKKNKKIGASSFEVKPKN